MIDNWIVIIKKLLCKLKKFKINIEDEFEVIWKVKVKIINGFNCFCNLWI